ncbi:MAG: carbohydrate kinase family protein [Parcubacteria group bacterium]|nr:carbohydrate kinase family protein [Parcubacteria group bacterium]
MKCDVITIGTATRDVFLTSPLFRVLTDAAHLKKIGFPTGEAQCFALGGKVEIGAPVLTTGGGATNAAVTFGRQGFKTACLAKVGDDEVAGDIEAELANDGIGAILKRSATKKTAFSTILLVPSGERTILVYRGASEDLQKSDCAEAKKIKSRWAYFVPGGIKFEIIADLAEKLRRSGAFLAVNPSKPYIQMGAGKLKPLLKKMSVVILNREEAAYLTGCDYLAEEKIFKAMDALVDGIAVITDGPRGVKVSDGRAIYRAGIYKEKIVADRTGAGDAFGSGFVAGLMRARDSRRPTAEEIKYAIRLASANATAVVENVGAKKGILTRGAFEKSPRWRDLKIVARPL